MRDMELRISVEQAAASLDALLDRVNASGESVIIERGGKPVGRLTPTSQATMSNLVGLLESWQKSDDGWADAVEEAVRAGNQPLIPESPWDR